MLFAVSRMAELSEESFEAGTAQQFVKELLHDLLVVFKGWWSRHSSSVCQLTSNKDLAAGNGKALATPECGQKPLRLHFFTGTILRGSS